MKKIAFIICIVGSLMNTQSASAQAFDDGTNVVSIGFGLPASKRVVGDIKDFYYNDKNIKSEYKLTNIGTLVLKYEHGLHKYFGLGLNMEYSASKASFKYQNINTGPEYAAAVKRNIIGGFLRFNAHYPLEKIDIYGGAGLGYLYTMDKYTTTNPNATIDKNQSTKIFDFDYQLTLGARFMIKDNIGMFFEAGRATTICQLGIAFKF